MLGSGIGQLKVLVGDTVLWSRIGEQGDKWIQASVEIRMDKEMQVLAHWTKNADQTKIQIQIKERVTKGAYH